MLKTFPTQQWDDHFPDSTQQQAIHSLENGDILFFPHLTFALSPEETVFLSPEYADPLSKNIGYQAKQRKLWGVQNLTDEQRIQLKLMLDRFSRHAFELIEHLLPCYTQQIMLARTSFRPVQVSGRKTSARKDDKRLHIDAFPSAPNQGKRILRVFCNINPHGEDRIWRIGEPFEQVAKRFLPRADKPRWLKSFLLRLFRVTKSYRTPYDHYMLQLHDKMKADEDYQQQAPQQEIRFPANSTWIVQTDHVSHAAMQGQYVLEQTFYLPIKGMKDESLSPLRVLERELGESLL